MGFEWRQCCLGSLCSFILYQSNFQSISSCGTHKLITNILRHTIKYIIYFCWSDENKYSFDSFTWDSYCYVDYCYFLKFLLLFNYSYMPLFFLFDNPREKKRSVPLTKQSGTACFKTSCNTPECFLQHTSWKSLWYHVASHVKLTSTHRDTYQNGHYSIAYKSENL